MLAGRTLLIFAAFRPVVSSACANGAVAGHGAHNRLRRGAAGVNASTVAVVAPNLGWLIAFRVLLGIGTCAARAEADRLGWRCRPGR
jgi:hypothetical protein